MDRINDSRNYITKRRLLATSGALALTLSIGACGESDSPEKSCETQEVIATESLNTLSEMASVALTQEVIARSPDAADIDSVGIMQFDQHDIDVKVYDIQRINDLNSTAISLGETYLVPVCLPKAK